MKEELKVKPHQFIKALSMALELSSTGISNHHVGTATICKAFGKELGMEGRQLESLVVAALIHDIGAASSWDEKHYIAHFDEDHRIFDHAEKGYILLKDTVLFEDIAQIIRHHHDRYNGPNPSGLMREEIPLASRIIHLSDRLDVLIDPNINIMRQKERITYALLESDHFDPNLITIFERLALRESFWLTAVTTDYQTLLEDFDSLFGVQQFEMMQLVELAELLAFIIDASSDYTANHSRNVAHVAQALIKARGGSRFEQDLFYIAGLLHDLGKLAVPNEILNKTQALNDEEILIMRQHPYYSEVVLRQVDALKNLSKWVGHHHELENGFGYPDRLVAEEIDDETRVLQVSDVFCALVEDRPYRPSMKEITLREVLKSMVQKGQLNAKFIQLILDDLHGFMACVVRKVSSV